MVQIAYTTNEGIKELEVSNELIQDVKKFLKKKQVKNVAEMKGFVSNSFQRISYINPNNVFDVFDQESKTTCCLAIVGFGKCGYVIYQDSTSQLITEFSCNYEK